MIPTEISSYITLVLTVLVSIGAGIFCVGAAVRGIKRQIKLHNSIALVELKCGKMHYYIFVIMLGIALGISFFMLFNIEVHPSLEFGSYFIAPWQKSVTYAFATLFLASAELLMVVLAMAKSAVVDKGVYIASRYLDWYNVRDYIMDERKCTVMLTSGKDAFASIEGVTPLLHVSKQDIAKLKFILNKNKNKFSESM